MERLTFLIDFPSAWEFSAKFWVSYVSIDFESKNLQYEVKSLKISLLEMITFLFYSI